MEMLGIPSWISGQASAGLFNRYRGTMEKIYGGQALELVSGGMSTIKLFN
jgi:hypothetical protein